MPIKFRCPHCRQFLGVSRSKAGSLADCPSCGRSLRIPQLDGKVEKVPTPELNLNNTGLRKALDSLAQLAEAGGEVADVETYSDQHGDMPVPRPEAEPSLPLVAATPKLVVEDVRAAASLPLSQQHRIAVEMPIEFDESTAEQHQNGKAGIAPIHETIDQVAVPRKADDLVPSLVALAQLANVPDAESPQARKPDLPISTNTAQGHRIEASSRVGSPTNEIRSTFPRGSVAPRSKTSLVLTSVISLLIGGGLGAFVMQSVARQDAEESSVDVESGNEIMETVSETTPTGPVGLTGRVNYVDADGQSRPDAGSRVLVLPADRAGTTLLPADAYRSGADAADRRIAEAALTALGGAFVTVNENGEYSTSLPAAASFHVLILSQHMANDLQGGHAADLLADYVDRPSALLGRVAWTVYSIRHPGSGSQSVDHTFVPPQGQ